MSFSLTGMAGQLMVIGAELGLAQHEMLEKSCVLLETSAKDAIGTYEFGWAPLAPSTLARKSADTPLLETGALKDSIEHQVHGSEAWVGTNSEIAIFHELGTRKMPARPFMGGALNAMGPEIEKELGAVVAKVFAKGT